MSIGWITDLTSTPEILPIAKEGKWSAASVIHDHLYATGRCLFKEPNADSGSNINTWVEKPVDRIFADRVYLLAMDSLGVNVIRRRMHYLGVRMVGWIRWSKARRVQHENQRQETVV